MTSILQSIKNAGALQAELVITRQDDISNIDKGYGDGHFHAHGDGSFGYVTQQQKNAVSQQFEAVLVKQFSRKPSSLRIKGVFSDDGNANRMHFRHFFTDAILRVVAGGGGFESFKYSSTAIVSFDDKRKYRRGSHSGTYERSSGQWRPHKP